MQATHLPQTWEGTVENDESWTFDLKGTPCDLLPILRALIRFERPWKDTIFTEEPSILQDEEIVGVTDAAPGAEEGDDHDSEEMSDEEREGEEEDERQRRPSRPSRTGGEKQAVGAPATRTEKIHSPPSSQAAPGGPWSPPPACTPGHGL